MKISRVVKFTFSYSIMMLTICLLATSILHAKTIKLNYSWFAPNSEPHYKVVQYFIGEIEKRTEGRVKIAYFPGGSLVGAGQAYDAVRKGITDLDFPCLAYTPSRFPVSFAWNLPLGIKSSTAATRMMADSLAKYRPKEFNGVKILYIWGSPPCQLHVKEKMDRMEDIVGRKIRSNGIIAELTRSLGGTPVSMPMSATYEALQKGVAEGTVGSSNSLIAFRLGELVSYEYKLNAVVVPFAFVMNEKKWKSLPADIQKIFEEVSSECVPLESKVWDESCVQGREFGKKQGMEFYEATPEMLKAIEAVRPAMYQNYLTGLKDLNLEKEGKAFLDYLISFSESDLNN